MPTHLPFFLPPYVASAASLSRRHPQAAVKLPAGCPGVATDAHIVGCLWVAIPSPNGKGCDDKQQERPRGCMTAREALSRERGRGATSGPAYTERMAPVELRIGDDVMVRLAGRKHRGRVAAMSDGRVMVTFSRPVPIERKPAGGRPAELSTWAWVLGGDIIGRAVEQMQTA